MTFRRYPLKMRIQIMVELLLFSVIVGRWLLPRFGISRDQLSQLLLINIGTAADILDMFEAFNEKEVRSNHLLKICILGVWQASLLQFCFNKAAKIKTTPFRSASVNGASSLAANSKAKKWRTNTAFDYNHKNVAHLPLCVLNLEQKKMSTPLDPKKSVSEQMQSNLIKQENKKLKFHCRSFCSFHVCLETELWAICLSLLLQDMPFFGIRLALLIYYNVHSYSHLFFTIKNALIILLQIFRSGVILLEYHRKKKCRISSPVSNI